MNPGGELALTKRSDAHTFSKERTGPWQSRRTWCADGATVAKAQPVTADLTRT
ncbi:hypothetical protein AB0950_39060 [Streptomyces sp. NPDC007189]|uniref:hypothetical protein n=1 Tax=Streptomyces sp. NPDC007189 TaxID=3154315 RepID=UPI0034537E7A